MCHHNFLALTFLWKKWGSGEVQGPNILSTVHAKETNKVGDKGMDDCRVKNRVCQQFWHVSWKSTSQWWAKLSMAARVVLDISRPFHNTNCHLYFDNFFDSALLLKKLLKVGIYGCGTLRANRYPGPYKVERSSIKLRPEEIRQLQKGICLSQFGTISVSAILSTNCQPNETVTVQQQTKDPPLLI